ncbi:hypothetical protein EMIHUDRAFT_438573, partial [Emiliania huxleyi CCMP1516]|uniref:Uncharacterized protein n=2 Tax=Emiliania huxleyi TaxID=2903 RepID=A0A0D3I8D9_EMIH1
MLEVDDCPKSADEARSLKKCSDPALQIGERCEADGECGTDVQLNNCLYYMDSFWGALSAFTGDIYRRVEMPASAAALPDDLKGLLAVELPDYHEALLRAGPGAADAGEPVDARAGRTYGVLLGMLCLLDGGLLLQLGHALRTLTPLAIWHPPLGAGGALTALSSLAAAAAGGVAAVLGVLALALPLSLCYFASDAEGLLGHVLGVLLLLHSAALALLCRSLAARGGEPYGILGPSHSMLRHPAASTRGTAAGSLACLGGGIAVLATVGTVFPSGVSGDVGLGWSLSGLRGEAL